MKKFLLAVLVCTAFCTFCQDYTDTKFGKDIDFDISKTSYDIDSTASAVILFEKAIISFKLDGDHMAMEESMHTRIKILDKSELDRGDLSFSYYSKSNTQGIERIKASSYNLVNGKIEENKLSRKDIFKVEEEEDWTKISFSIPNVKEGSIIEFSYDKVTRGRYTVPTWYFENDLPTLHSQLEFIQPNWFKYVILNRYKNELSVKETKDENFSFGAGYATVPSSRHIWISKNAPAIKEEAFVTTLDDYKDQIRFKLVSVAFPNQLAKSYNTTWEKVLGDLAEDEDFGDHFKGNNKVIDDIPASVINKESEVETAKAIYNYLQENVSWNERNGIYCFNSFKKILNSKEGSSPDINLLFARLLQGAGIDAKPLLISTRTHGAIEDIYPSMSAFNSVIVHAVLDDKPMLLNAVSDYGFDLPLIADLGEKGLLFDMERPRWIDIKSLIPKTTHFISVSGKLNTTGDITGKVTMQDNGYSAALAREKLKEKSFGQLLMKSSSDDVMELDIEDVMIENEREKHESLKCSGNFEIPAYATAVGDFIYLNPVLFDRIEDNQLKADNRTYPVDFPYPFTDMQKYTLTIPEGYIVQELPDPIRVLLPNKGGEFMYVIRENNGMLDVTSKMSIKRTVYNVAEYHHMKKFFDMAVENHSSQIVLKKTGE